jgi:hypothetical protein
MARAIGRLQSLPGRYCRLVDHGGWEEWDRCFTSDGVTVTRGNASAARRPGERPQLLRAGAVIVRGGHTLALGSYVDSLVLGEEGWQFGERRAEVDYRVRRAEPWLEPAG